MRAYQQELPEITRLGASLVAISPMLPDGTLSMAEKNELAFEVLSDPGNLVARAYGLVFRVADGVRELYEGPMSVDLPAYNGDDSWELPVPGTFVIDTAGTIRLAYANADHQYRLEPQAILDALAAL